MQTDLALAILEVIIGTVQVDSTPRTILEHRCYNDRGPHRQ